MSIAEPGHGPDGVERAPDVDLRRSVARRPPARARRSSIVRRWSERERRVSDDRAVVRPAHAELADDEAAEHRGDREGHAGDGADHPVGLVAAVLRHEQGDAGRQGDAPHGAGHRPAERQRHQQPEPRAGEAERARRRRRRRRRWRRRSTPPTPRSARTMASCLRWWSTKVPNHGPITAVEMLNAPPMTPVATTDRVSR